jgi:hypothetical protein
MSRRAPDPGAAGQPHGKTREWHLRVETGNDDAGAQQWHAAKRRRFIKWQ